MPNCISRIRIKNVKGFSDQTFNTEIIANKLHIFVAPNGFGKTSFATAFNSLNRNRIDLDEKNTHRCNISKKPEIELNYNADSEVTTYKATEKSNTISGIFDIFVIKSRLESHAQRQNHGRYSTAIASMRIKPITLINTIPPLRSFTYSIRTIRNVFGANANKLILNISPILNNKEVICYLDSVINWHELSLKRTLITFDNILNQSREIIGSKDHIIEELQTTCLPNIESNLTIKNAIDHIVTSCNITSRMEAFFVLWQLNYLKLHDSNFSSVLKYYEFCILKEQYTKTIQDFNSSWNNIEPKKLGQSLVVSFPEADYMSNGQRDLLSFVLLLKKAEQHFKKEKCILIIDEIFDYLDDANLVAFQYYISKFIQDFKSQKRELYPILMTHLDPMLFAHFRLNGYKTHYLDDRKFSDSLHLLKLIKERSNDRIKDFVDHYLFHYDPEPAERSTEFLSLGIKKNFSDTATFHPLIIKEVKQYLNGQPADPFAVCIATRVRIEKNACDQLSTPELKREFITTHETIKKLEFCLKKGVEIPEIYFLLSIIYNSTLHATDKNAETIAKQLLRNLTNITIKNMIASLFPEFKEER